MARCRVDGAGWWPDVEQGEEGGWDGGGSRMWSGGEGVAWKRWLDVELGVGW